MLIRWLRSILLSSVLKSGYYEMVNRHFLFLFAFIFPTSPLFAQIANDISFEFGSACQRGHGNSVIAINNNTSDRAVVTVEISSQISDYDQITQPSVESKFQYPATDDVSLLPGERKVVGCQRLRVGNETANHQYSVSGAFISPPLSEFPKPDRPQASILHLFSERQAIQAYVTEMPFSSSIGTLDVRFR